jgi:hypothetical protein
MNHQAEETTIAGKLLIAYKIDDKLWLDIESVLRITHSTEAELLTFASSDDYGASGSGCLRSSCNAPAFDLFALAYLDCYCEYLGYDNPKVLAERKKRAPENVGRLEKLIKAGFTLDGLLAASIRSRVDGSKNRSTFVSGKVLRAAEKMIEGEWDEHD